MKSLTCTSKLVAALTGGVFLTSICFADDHAKDKEDIKFNLKDITCWDLGTIEEDAAALTLMMLYGYHAGSNNVSEHSSKKIEYILTNVGPICEENPDMTALEALKKAVK
jgi:hypothetical protein